MGYAGSPGGLDDRGHAAPLVGEQAYLRGVLGDLDDLPHDPLSGDHRKPRGHTVSIVYTSRGRGVLRAADDAVKAGFFRLDGLPTGIAFDHRAILADYAEWLKSKPPGGDFHA